MRPRLLHLGYLVVRPVDAVDWAASMRPRLLHLGYLMAASTPRAVNEELQ